MKKNWNGKFFFAVLKDMMEFFLNVNFLFALDLLYEFFCKVLILMDLIYMLY